MKGVKVVIDETTGSIQPGLEELKEAANLIHQSGFQMAMHAIEPSAIDAAIQAISFALERSPKKNCMFKGSNISGITTGRTSVIGSQDFYFFPKRHKI